MKVDSVRAFPLVTPLDPELMQTAFGSRKNAALVLVEIRTDGGLVGYGEALARFSLRSYISLIDDLLAPLVIGQDPFDVEGMWQRMSRVFPGSKTGGVLMEAIAAVDIALWDIMGKAAGLPVHKLLGSTGAQRVKAYASSISWAGDEVAIRQTEEVLALGFDTIKIKIGGPPEKGLARAKLIRDTAGPSVALCADANWSFDFDDALTVAKGLADLDYYWFEEPLVVEDQLGYRRLRERAPIRLAAGESEHTLFGCRELIASGSIGVVQPDVARSGGITETRKIASLAYAFNMPYAPHVGFSGAVCAAASLQLAAAAPNFLTFECMTFPNPLRESLSLHRVGHPADLVDGTLPVPALPGLGVEIDQEALERFRADR